MALLSSCRQAVSGVHSCCSAWQPWRAMELLSYLPVLAAAVLAMLLPLLTAAAGAAGAPDRSPVRLAREVDAGAPAAGARSTTAPGTRAMLPALAGVGTRAHHRSRRAHSGSASSATPWALTQACIRKHPHAMQLLAA